MNTRFATQQELFRYARPSDLPAIVKMLQDPEVGRWLWFVPASNSALESRLRPVIDDQWQSLADTAAPRRAMFVIEAPQGEFLGQAMATAVEGSARGFDVAVRLARASWRRGVGTRAARFVAAWAVALHDAYRLEASCLEGNEGPQKIVSALGLREEGRRPNYRLKGEARHTELLYGATVASLDASWLDALIQEAGLREA